MGIEEKVPTGILLTTVEKLVNWSRKSSDEYGRNRGSIS